MVDPPRSAARRKADALARLTSPAVDVFVATASAAGVAHLVPLSLRAGSPRPEERHVASAFVAS